MCATKDGDGLLVGMNNEDMMISNLSQVLDEERKARRTAEEENERLQAEADGEWSERDRQAVVVCSWWGLLSLL